MNDEMLNSFNSEELEKRFEMGWRVKADICTGDDCVDR